MNRFTLLLLAAPLLALGCESDKHAHHRHHHDWDRQAEMERWTIRSYQDDQLREGIVRQHTLYPYQFDRDGSALNELGKHDMEVLADHYRTNPGPLNVPRGDANPSLYQARVQSVRTALTDAGVRVEEVRIVDDLPGGDGIASTRVREILDRESAEKSDQAEKTVELVPMTKERP